MSERIPEETSLRHKDASGCDALQGFGNRIGLGCAVLGQPHEFKSDAEAAAVMEAAYEAGIRIFDAAPLYGGGLAEERLGRLVRQVPRDSITLCTKAGVDRPYGQGPVPPSGTRRREADIWDYSQEALSRSVQRSLDRLNTDRLDIVHLHDADNRVEEAISGYSHLNAMKMAGTIGAVGAGSNHVETLQGIIDAVPLDAILMAGRLTPLDHSGAALVKTCAERSARVVLGGIYNSGILATWPATGTFFNGPAREEVRDRTARLAKVCEAYAVPLRAAALHYPLHNAAVSTVLIGPASLSELKQTLDDLACAIPDKLWTDLADADGRENN